MTLLNTVAIKLRASQLWEFCFSSSGRFHHHRHIFAFETVITAVTCFISEACKCVRGHWKRYPCLSHYQRVRLNVLTTI